MKTTKTKQQGIALVLSLFLIVILTGLSAALFLVSTQEITVADKEMASISARYAADEGMAYLWLELINHDGNWVTHNVIPGADLRLNPKTAAETPGEPDPNFDVSTGHPLVCAALSNSSPPTCMIDADGSYVPGDGSRRFALKVYIDPSVQVNSQRIILAQGNSGTTSRLFATTVFSSNLYEYFVFNPGWAGFRQSTWNAAGGKMYAGLGFQFQELVTFNDIAALITPGYIRYVTDILVPSRPRNINSELTTGLLMDGVTPNSLNAGKPVVSWNEVVANFRVPSYPRTFVPVQYCPGWSSSTGCSDPAQTNINYLQRQDLPVVGETAQLLMRNSSGTIVRWDGTFNSDGTPTYIDPRSLDTAYEAVYRNSWPSDLVKIRPYTEAGNAPYTRIPSRLESNRSYLFNVFAYRGTQNKPDGTPDYFTWVDATNNTRYYYPITEASGGLIPARYTNSQYLGSEWANWISGTNLNGVIKEAGTGGYRIDPVSVEAQNYETTAETSGIYINATNPDDFSTWTVKINGTTYNFADDCDASGDTDDTLCVNNHIIMEKRQFIDVNSTRTKHIIRLNVHNMTEAGANPESGIIFSNPPIALAHAETLPEGGLTTTTKDNLYLEGNYNTNGFEPSAVIVAKYTYTLSGAGENDELVGEIYPSNLRNSISNPNYPQEDDYSPTSRPGVPASHWAITYGSWSNYLASAANPAPLAHAVPPRSEGGDYTYNVSIIGPYADSISTLELWNRGTLYGDGPRRTINGAFVKLEAGKFPANNTIRDSTRWRHCGNVQDGRKFGESYNGQPAQFPEYANNCKTLPQDWGTAGVTGPYHLNNINDFETRYLTEGYPPGQLSGITDKAWIELASTTDNFTRHCRKLAAGDYAPPYCGNGVCDAGETKCGCNDCRHHGDICQNHKCEAEFGENYHNDPMECLHVLPCFLADTPILMADGSTKAIEDIAIDDTVFSFNETTRQLEADIVKEIKIHKADSYLLVNGNLKATPNHLMYTGETYVPIGELKIGDNLITRDGQPEPINDIQQVNEPAVVYNFEVTTNHNYIAGGYVVHNRKRDPREIGGEIGEVELPVTPATPGGGGGGSGNIFH